MDILPREATFIIMYYRQAFSLLLVAVLKLGNVVSYLLFLALVVLHACSTGRLSLNICILIS